MDPDEDSSVTAAIVNVVCELGWRRPHDFLPLAPRLFELLVDGGNNWMAIKLIKLVRGPCVLSFAFPDHVVVCHSHPPGATPGSQIITAANQPDPDYAGNVSVVRVHQRHHPGRYSRRWGGFLGEGRSSFTLCHKVTWHGVYQQRSQS